MLFKKSRWQILLLKVFKTEVGGLQAQVGVITLKQPDLQSAPLTKNNMKILFIAKDGFPVEGIIGHPFINFLRKILYTRRITTYARWLKNGGCKINFGN